MSATPTPPAPGYWLASDGNWYPPRASPSPVLPKEEGPSVITIVAAVVFLILVASGAFKAWLSHHQTSALYAMPPAATSSPIDTQSALDLTWFNMTTSQQVEFCSDLATHGRAATTHDIMSGADDKLSEEGVVSWLELKEDQCKPILQTAE